MAEVIGGAFLSAFFQSLFDRIGSDEIIGFFRGKKDFEGLLRKLKMTLLYVGAVLDDAEMKQLRNPRVKEWLEGLKEAVEDAENLLDEISTDALEKKIIGSTSSASGVKGFFSRKTKMNEILGKLKIIDAESGTTCCTGFVKGFLDSRDRDRKAKMEEIIEGLENFAGQKDVLGLKEVAGERLSRRDPSTCLVEYEVYGRDDDKVGVKNLVLSDGAKAVSVIPIVGMGGVGKTTLAQAVFNDDEVEKRFEVKAWTCVSEEFDVCKVTKNVLEAVTKQACDAMELNMLQVRLKEKLEGKRFLVVLDDVWNEKYEDWVALKKPFQDGAEGSKIIVTTRSNGVVLVMGGSPTHHLKVLSDEDCWKLFAKHASGNEDFLKNPRLEAIGRKIAKKCKGLPLAAKTLGGMLQSKLDVGEWERVLKCEIWDLSDKKSNILPALLVSYHYLPSNLKRCFAYCSMFPKDYEFEKEKLVLLWMAEGLLGHSNGNKRMEDEGDEFFKDLLSRSFFQQSRINYENKPCFVMHDLMVDLAKFVSGNCFQLGVDNSSESMKKVRHLAYYSESYDSLTRFDGVSEATRLRTFLPLYKNCIWSNISDVVVHDLIFNLKCLRSLSLSDYSNVRKLPDLIGELKHLRYLDLSFTSITQLPESVCGLYNLQTLNLSGCESLTRLPRYMHRLINLQFLRISESCIEMPASMSKLNNLRALNIFIVGKDNETTIGELGELSKLGGSLCIKKLRNVANPKDASKAKMDKKSLKELSLDWSDEDTNDSAHENLVLENLVPYITLESLAINHYGGTSFPTWLGDHLYRNMVEMKLSNCKNCSSLPPLGQLVSLKTLTIEGFSAIETVDHGFYGNCAFASLENLHFRHMSIWQDWLPMPATDVGLFPKLKHLELSGCPKFTGNLPDSFQSLAVLQIEKCQQISCSLPSMPVVRKLKLVDCENLLSQELPPTVQSLVIGGFNTLVSLSETLKVMETCLEELKIEYCPSLTTLGALPRALKKLEISYCAKLEFPFPRSHESLDHLLISRSCESMQRFQLNSFTNLGELYLHSMENLESLSVSVSDGKPQDMPSLSYLYIQHCPSFSSFPGGGFSAPKLDRILIAGLEKLKCLPEQMSTLFPHLKSLIIYDCPMIESFPQAGLPSDLHRLCISRCDKLVASHKNWNLTRLTKLDCFAIFGSSEIRCFPEEGQLPATITRLYIDNLSSLETLDQNGVQELTSLKDLKIENCTNLHTVPVEGLPNSLRLLEISKCPLLEETKLKMQIRECSKDIRLVIE